jgi:hypothetical protein
MPFDPAALFRVLAYGLIVLLVLILALLLWIGAVEASGGQTYPLPSAPERIGIMP